MLVPFFAVVVRGGVVVEYPDVEYSEIFVVNIKNDHSLWYGGWVSTGEGGEESWMGFPLLEVVV